ncbi:MAG: hypothetical protein ABMB14_38825, partial [Myxococcota bacterium]
DPSATPRPKPTKPDPAPVPAKPVPGKPVPGKPVPGTPGAVTPEPDLPVPAPAPSRRPVSDAGARVTIRSSGRGSVSGCSGNKRSFEGSGAFSIEKYLLPATCLVTIDGARGVFQVYGSGTVTCDKQGTVVVCDKTSVP